MQVSLGEILNLKNETRTMDLPVEADSIYYMGRTSSFRACGPIHLSLQHQSGRKIRLNVAFAVELDLNCDRCLEPLTRTVEVDLEYLLIINEDGSACTEDDDESLSYIDGYNLDVDGLVKEEVMIGFPMKVLCGEDCKGICKVCGANLNKGECGCDRTEPDPRMSKIRDIFNQKEV